MIRSIVMLGVLVRDFGWSRHLARELEQGHGQCHGLD